jgi:hypothetical protein
MRVESEDKDVLEEKSVSNRKGAPVRPFFTGFLAAVALLAVAYLMWQHFAPPSAATSSPVGSAMLAVSPHASASVDSLAALVAEETAKLGVKSHTIVLTTDKAMSAADALRRGDYHAAEVLAKNVLAESKLQVFSFHPFNAFINSLS